MDSLCNEFRSFDQFKNRIDRIIKYHAKRRSVKRRYWDGSVSLEDMEQRLLILAWEVWSDWKDEGKISIVTFFDNLAKMRTDSLDRYISKRERSIDRSVDVVNVVNEHKLNNRHCLERERTERETIIQSFSQWCSEKFLITKDSKYKLLAMYFTENSIRFVPTKVIIDRFKATENVSYCHSTLAKFLRRFKETVKDVKDSVDDRTECLMVSAKKCVDSYYSHKYDVALV